MFGFIRESINRDKEYSRFNYPFSPLLRPLAPPPPPPRPDAAVGGRVRLQAAGVGHPGAERRAARVHRVHAVAVRRRRAGGAAQRPGHAARQVERTQQPLVAARRLARGGMGEGGGGGGGGAWLFFLLKLVRENPIPRVPVC